MHQLFVDRKKESGECIMFQFLSETSNFSKSFIWQAAQGCSKTVYSSQCHKYRSKFVYFFCKLADVYCMMPIISCSNWNKILSPIRCRWTSVGRMFWTLTETYIACLQGCLLNTFSNTQVKEQQYRTKLFYEASMSFEDCCTLKWVTFRDWKQWYQRSLKRRPQAHLFHNLSSIEVSWRTFVRMFSLKLDAMQACFSKNEIYTLFQSCLENSFKTIILKTEVILKEGVKYFSMR